MIARGASALHGLVAVRWADDRRALRVLTVLSLALFAIATGLRLRGIPQGDEPHYLILGQALAEYGSLDPTPVYENADYLSYFPKRIDPHVWPGLNGRPVPSHNFGGPLLWLLPFLLWGRAGAHLVIVAVSVLLVRNVYQLLRELGITTGYAAAVTAMFAVGTPLYVYSSMLFVEPIGALLVLYAVRVILTPRPTLPRLALASTGLGYLPWVHGRFALFTVVLGGLLLVRLIRDPPTRGAPPFVFGLAPLAVLVTGVELLNLTRYGTLNPAPGNAIHGDSLFQIPVHVGLVNLAFDGKFGLLPFFPLLALALPGLFLALPRGPARVHVVLLGTVVPYVLAVSTFGGWWGGYSPPARFLAVVTPVLAYYVAVTLQHVRHWLMTSVAVAASLMAFALAVATDVSPGRRFHAYPAPDRRSALVAWIVALAVLAGTVWLARRRATDTVRVPAQRSAESPAMKSAAGPPG
jgi:hypothetical protein